LSCSIDQQSGDQQSGEIHAAFLLDESRQELNNHPDFIGFLAEWLCKLAHAVWQAKGDFHYGSHHSHAIDMVIMKLTALHRGICGCLGECREPWNDESQ
jgi:hypothetical protein